MTNAKIGKLAAKDFRAKALPRGQTIAATITQQGAEGMKSIEAGVVTNALEIEPQKQWLTRGDEVVRAAHSIADMQVRNESEPFEVGGESLMFPGDTNLGASIGNTIRCRCSSILFIE